MAIQYNFATEGGLLLVTSSGFDESLEEVMEYGMAILQEIQHADCTALLCDETRLEYRLGTVDTYKSAEFMASQAPRLGKAALVCNDRFIKDAKFWETVAVNRGLTIRVFKDMGEARDWLVN